MVIAGRRLERDRAGVLKGPGLPLALTMGAGVAIVAKDSPQFCGFGPRIDQGHVDRAA
jgi:hypothetical protein